MDFREFCTIISLENIQGDNSPSGPFIIYRVYKNQGVLIIINEFDQNHSQNDFYDSCEAWYVGNCKQQGN